MEPEIYIQSIRRLALVVWLKSRVGWQQVATEQRLSQSVRSQISQFNRGYNFGERAARNLERALGMPPHLLDTIPKGYESSQDDLTTCNLHFVLKQITGAPAYDVDMIRRDACSNLALTYRPQNTQQEGRLARIPRIRVSSQWLKQNISNFECVKDFCIVVDAGIHQDAAVPSSAPIAPSAPAPNGLSQMLAVLETIAEPTTAE